MIPSDPAMLVSFVNLKLRDYDKDLDALCEDLGLDRGELEDKLKSAGYRYDRDANRFR